MKYNEDQKEKVVNQGLCIRRESVSFRDKLRKQFPISVLVQDGFYVVESKMNFL